MKKLLFVLSFIGFNALRTSGQTLAAYQATVAGQTPNYYFKFDGGSLANSGTNSTVVSWSTTPPVFTQFTFDIFGNPQDSVYFSSTKTDVITDPNESSDKIISSGGNGTATTNSTAQGSITFLFRSLDPGVNTAQKYLFSSGILNSNHNSCSLLFQNTNINLGTATNALVLRLFDGDTTILPYTNLVPNTWYYFALTYTEATNDSFFDSTGTNLVTVKSRWYLGVPGGTLATGTTTNAIDSVAGDGTFYLGNGPTTTAGFGLPGNGQLDEFATWARRLSDSEIQAQFAKLPSLTAPPRSQYQSVVAAESPSYYFKLDGDYVDSVGGTLTLKSTNGIPLGFTYDFFGNSTGAVLFVNGADTLTNNGNLLSGGGVANGSPGTGQGSISCLFWTLGSTNVGGQRFVYSAGGNTTVSNGFGLLVDNATASSNPLCLKLRFGDTSSAILQATNIVTSAWYYFAMNYDESLSTNQVNWWLGQPGGTLNSGTFSVAVGSKAGGGNVFFIGNNTNYNAGWRNSNPTSSGRIDEFAIWHSKLTATQVLNQFNALSVAAPLLSITLSGTNVIISWPGSTSSAYVLESATDLASTAWGGAGSAVLVNGNYVVTNALTPDSAFYRLHKP
jgi:hypothetical protein